MRLDKEELYKLNLLSDKINDNTANLNDYEEYEKLLIKGGFEREEIFEKLKEANIDSYKELIEKRNHVAKGIRNYSKDALEERKVIEGIAVVALVSLGIAVLFGLLINSKSE